MTGTLRHEWEEQDEEFGERRLIDLLTESRHLAPGAIQQRILASLAEFCPGGVQDDATLLTVAVGDIDIPRGIERLER